jgi:DNA-directed RNA polymerase I, II, and III subunit RPABC2
LIKIDLNSDYITQLDKMDDDGPGAENYDVEDIEEDLDDFEEEEGDVPEVEGVPVEQKVQKESRATKFLAQNHPECRIDYIEEINKKLPLSHYPPTGGKDPNHRSVPYLTIFERTKIIGFRSNQLSQGARPLIQVPDHVTDVMDIARLELEQKRLPFLLKRPMPDGEYEYWRLQDLVQL